MRASIVIPCYNQQEFVCEAVASALAQTHKDTEVICVNDGSTDDSLRLVREYEGVTVIDQKNAGLSAARNAGFSIATGEFFLPLDADDFIDPTYLEKTLPPMGDPQVGVVATYTQYFGVGDAVVVPRNLTFDNEKWSNEIPTCSLVRRTAFEEAGGYEVGQGTVFAEDWELWVDIMKHGWKVAVVNEPLFFYRTKPVSLNTANVGKKKEMLEKIKRLHPDLYGGPHG